MTGAAWSPKTTPSSLRAVASNRLDGRSEIGSRLTTIYSAAVAFLVSVAFWPFILTGATTPRWLVGITSLYFLTLPALLFLAYVFAVLDLDAAVKWSIVAGAFCWGARSDDDVTRAVAQAFAAGLAVSGGVAVVQWLGYDRFSNTAEGLAGLFGNKNAMGEAAAVTLIVALRHRAWAALVACLPALLLSTSRSAWLAAVIAVGVEFRWRWQVWLGLATALIWAFALMPGGSDTLMQRVALWGFAVPLLQWFGAGSPFEPLHNEFIQVAFELGVGSVVIYAVLFMVASRDLALAVCVAVLCTFGYVIHLPASGWLIAFSCGSVVGSLRHDERNRIRSARHDGGFEVVPSFRA